jgi:hypothetical protein
MQAGSLFPTGKHVSLTGENFLWYSLSIQLIYGLSILMGVGLE